MTLLTNYLPYRYHGRHGSVEGVVMYASYWSPEGATKCLETSVRSTFLRTAYGYCLRVFIVWLAIMTTKRKSSPSDQPTPKHSRIHYNYRIHPSLKIGGHSYHKHSLSPGLQKDTLSFSSSIETNSKDIIIAAIRQGKYFTALNAIYKTTAGSRSMERFLVTESKRQARLAKYPMLRNDFTFQNLQKFDMAVLSNAIFEEQPLLANTLIGTMHKSTRKEMLTWVQ